LIGASLLLAGCGSLPDIPDIPDFVNPLTWFQDDEPAQGVAAKKDYPKLSSVPSRPSTPSLETQQAKIQQGLIADQQNARYSDTQVRREADRRRATGSAVRQVPPPIARSAVPPPPVARRANTQVAAIPAAPLVPSVPRSVPTARQAAPSMGQAGQMVKIATIYFGNNSKQLQDDDLSILRQIAAVQRNTGAIIRIVGHASSRGKAVDLVRRAKINYTVSLDRAKAIAAVLVGMGVPEKSLQVGGAGDSAPIYAENTVAGEAANRRAELYLLN
jgi:outer membrane protein OmpA-like peptidoglycan-associated protein